MLIHVDMLIINNVYIQNYVITFNLNKELYNVLKIDNKI